MCEPRIIHRSEKRKKKKYGKIDENESEGEQSADEANCYKTEA